MTWHEVHHLHGLLAVGKWKRLTSDTAHKTLRDLKAKISSQSKKNFVLEKDVRYLDSRIALLIQNRIAMEEVGELLSWRNGCNRILTLSTARRGRKFDRRRRRRFRRGHFPKR